jgi:hypothetical protein
MVPVLFSQGFSAKTAVPLFLFSGQSNMVCLGAANGDLTADQKKAVDSLNKAANIKIDCVADNNTKKWSTLGMGFGADATHFGVELFFGKVLSDSMSGKKIAFIKNAKSGTYLGNAKGGWLPPSSNNGTPGDLYKGMMTQIDNALKSFNSAFDTALYTPRWVGFIWLQGEFDGQSSAASLAAAYETNLTNLVKDIRTKTGVEDLPIVLAMIKPISMWALADKIRNADIALTKKIKNCDTMDTKDLALSSDGVHYNGQSMVIIGTKCAQRWLAMKYLDAVVPVINVPGKTISAVSSISKNVFSYDLTGRKIMQLPVGVLENTTGRSTHMIINVNGNKAEKALPITQR